MAKQIFPNSAIMYFFHKEIINKNPEYDKRFIFTEDLSYDTLVSKFRGFSNHSNPESLFNNKLPIFGYTRPLFKRFEGLSMRNTVKVQLTKEDIDLFDSELKSYFYKSDKEIVDLTGALIQSEYKFIILHPDIDVIDQYEQAYINKLFLSDISYFKMDGSELGFGSNSLDLEFDVIWNDLEEIKINRDGVEYNGISGSCNIYGVILYSSGIPSYAIDKINLKVNELVSKNNLDNFSITILD